MDLQEITRYHEHVGFYVQVEDAKVLLAEIERLKGECARLRHIVNILKFHAITAGDHAKEVEDNVTVVDGRVKVWFFGEWIDVQDAQKEAEEEGIEVSDE